jgi:hypothetical protein
MPSRSEHGYEPTDPGVEDQLSEWKGAHDFPSPKPAWRWLAWLVIKGLLLLCVAYVTGGLLFLFPLVALFGGPMALIVLAVPLLVIVGLARSMAASFSRR